MKIKKIGVIAAAVPVMASLAVSASVSASNNSVDSNVASKAITYVVDAGVDVSDINLANVQKGEIIVIGSVEQAAITEGCTTQPAGE